MAAPSKPIPPECSGASLCLTKDADTFYDSFTQQFFSVDGELRVAESQRREALALCKQADKKAALACMEAFGSTHFLDDLLKVTVPSLILHGDGDAIVPFEGSGQRTHAILLGSDLHVIKGAPHGCNVSHPDEWNQALITFLGR